MYELEYLAQLVRRNGECLASFGDSRWWGHLFKQAEAVG